MRRIIKSSNYSFGEEINKNKEFVECFKKVGEPIIGQTENDMNLQNRGFSNPY